LSAITAGTALHSFLEAFRKAIGDVFTQALAANWTVQTEPHEAAAPQPEQPSALSVQFAAAGGLQGEAVLTIRSSEALLIAQKFLAEPSDSSAELKSDHKDALEELLRQVSGLVVTSLKSTFGEIKLDVSTVEPPSWQGTSIEFRASEPSGGSLLLRFSLSPQLTQVLSASKPPPKNSEAPTSLPPSTSDTNLDLLLGVNLNLLLRFGQSVLSLREILNLSSGAVIELDREVQEPADLLLGDKLIARGEVVIVDGSYGLRVTEVADARQGLEKV